MSGIQLARALRILAAINQVLVQQGLYRHLSRHFGTSMQDHFLLLHGSSRTPRVLAVANGDRRVRGVTVIGCRHLLQS